MPRPTPKDELDENEKAVRARPGITSAEIEDVLGERAPRRTLQHRLKRLVDDRRLIRDGEKRGARYRTPEAAAPAPPGTAAEELAVVTLSGEGEEIRAQVRQPVGARNPVGYNRNFLDSYRPREAFY